MALPSMRWTATVIGIIGLTAFTSGCTQHSNILRDQAKLGGQTVVNAVAPVFDPAGGSLTPQGRNIERSLSRDGGF